MRLPNSKTCHSINIVQLVLLPNSLLVNFCAICLGIQLHTSADGWVLSQLYAKLLLKSLGLLEHVRGGKLHHIA